MPNNNYNASDRTTLPAVIEFDWPLHVHKKRFRDREDYLYTIAIWENNKLNSICLMKPLETALNALSELLRKAGTDLPLPADCSSK